MTVLSDLQHFPLSEAYHCPDCNHLGNCATQCPSCGNEHNLHPVASWLDTPQQQDADDLHDYLVEMEREDELCPKSI